MKHVGILLLALLLVCGCTVKTDKPQGDAPAATVEPDGLDAPEGTPLFAFNDRLAAIQARVESDPPVAVSYRFQGEGDGTNSPLFGADAVDALYAALSAVTVGPETYVMVTDSDEWYSFVYADGTSDSVCFNGGNLYTDGKCYTLESAKALRADVFPTVGRDRSLTDTYPDNAYRAFAAAFDTAAPVRLTVTLDGREADIEDAERIREAFYLLQNAQLCFCDTGGPSPGSNGVSDRPDVTLTFTLADGTDFAYVLAGRNLVVAFPEPLGIYWYWLWDSADDVLDFAARAVAR